MRYLIESDAAHLMSEPEMAYAWRLNESKKTLLNDSFFMKIPNKLNILNQEEMDKRLGKN